MRKIDYVIQNMSPVNFAEKSTDSIFYATKKYITGSAMRGALAMRYIADKKLTNPHLDDVFNQLFLNGQVRYLPAYPIGKADENTAEALVLPPSIVKSKDGMEIYDLSATGEKGAGFKKCQGMAVYESGNYYKVDTTVQIEMHMGRNSDAERIKGSSKDGNIYNYEYIEPMQKFKGAILVDDDIADVVDKLFKRLSGKVIYFGRAKNAQYGKCLMSFSPSVPVSSDVRFEGEMYLYALSPFIPYIPFQNIADAASQVVDAVNEVLGTDALKLADTYFANKEEINGYVGVWRTKREKVNAVSAGSLIKVNLAEGIDVNKLAEVLYIGFGERTAEGYGQFRIWKPMTDVKLDEYPEKSVPVKLHGAVKSQALAIINDKIMLEVRKLAMETADEIKVDDTSGKHIINRIALLMDTGEEKQVIQGKIRRGFAEIAKKNLKTFGFGRNNLFELLVEDNGIRQPYFGIKWEERLQLVELKSDIEKDFGSNVFEVDENKVYRTYWLWVARHLIKKMRNMEGSED